ncbi:MFS general substrate transporter [Hortaea werneckii]|uniref:Major facilitator superfamily (MFS) profile domain-containing protein n=1 Tax=Hortaea werneckii TaxID=91943 RepID=A0A3M7GG86_HORWE|nr:MFS general substrate transporter [Hortaea werneckii]KAI7607430.1 MFS general substrate transporter [Hortaea werneckii]KAI7636578.1 MFS general substrate transporter [Hortaea werneckii]KAI7681410.1 MFS general substrate transporter [Hortaea werneckii]KAI7704220.1 MFS general substrate transporter [Hortaea werneckii]
MARPSDEKMAIDERPDYKENVESQVDEYTNAGLSPEDLAFLQNFPPEHKKKLLRKMDWRLVPLLLFLYLITYIDKVNIGNAKIEGLLPSLGMDGTDYNVAVSIFFIPYILAEVPSNMILQHFKRPSHYLCAIVLAWGIVMTCTGTVQDFGELVAVRFLLGLFEAGLFPGAILLISRWYMPNETQTRIALLYTAAASGGAFSGLLAYAIAKMDGVGGYDGWRWIFIIEGLATILMGVLCIVALPDSPSLSSRWLTEDEARYLTLRQVTRAVKTDPDGPKHKVDWAVLWSVVSDWKVYFLLFANWSQSVPNYALKFAMPTIMRGMGYKSANAQLLTIPPYTCGALSSYGFSVLADKYEWRMPFIVAPQVSVVIGYAILCAKAGNIEDNIGVCYFAVCVACFGLYPILPGVNAWNISNCSGPKKRAISIAYLICAGNIGGLIGSYIYIDSEAPSYPTGYGCSLAFAATGIVAAVSLEGLLMRSNKINAQMTEEEVRAKFSDEKLHQMGDRSPLYKYHL